MIAPAIAAAQSAATDSTSLPATVGAKLYVANGGASTVTVYAPDSKKLLRTISQGVVKPTALAFDGSGNLYVANCGSYCGGKGSNGTVTVYAPGKAKVLRTISQGVSSPQALAFDGSGNLYVANCG
jgi:DNA-binding beta-propeller fold protein YncE